MIEIRGKEFDVTFVNNRFLKYFKEHQKLIEITDSKQKEIIEKRSELADEKITPKEFRTYYNDVGKELTGVAEEIESLRDKMFAIVFDKNNLIYDPEWWLDETDPSDKISFIYQAYFISIGDTSGKKKAVVK